ncbi:PWWP domain-containing protein [Carex littledalei]|uniref:PWWP domain-containing protein n=1 Tax=Carex littledalei TaxID=544730 RepID=A0A833R768_9POAL|nr:PWWP domain-containing protein [Carex littledalei]
MKSQSAIVETPSIPNLCRKARSRRKCNRSLKVEDSSLEHLNIEDAPNFNHHWGRNAINFLENSSEVPVVQVESVPYTKNCIFQKQWQMAPAVGDRKDTNSNACTSSHCFNQSVPTLLQKCNTSNSWLFPGIVVWAKKANNEWWPAEVVDATSILKCTGSYSIGRSLVKFFDDDKYAWLDPIRQISEFHAFYEERSQSRLKNFQDALHEALQKHSHLAPDISPRKCSASSDTEGTVSPSFTEDQSSERRGKRKRKTKIHFDELILSDKPVKRVRTTRIMRHLGLIAPVGSPFSLSRATSDAV